MIQYTSNINIVVSGVTAKLRQLQENPDAMLRTVAMAMLPEIKKRVHVEGKDSSGQQIGTYSKAYMVVRTGAYKNADRYKKGKHKGKNKNAGVVSKQRVATPYGKSAYAYQNIEGDKIARPQYHRSSDPKVILSLTRQMENDLSIVPTPSGYGIGYNNPDNFKKSQYNEKTYRKRIWAPTAEELALAKHTAENYVTEIFE